MKISETVRVRFAPSPTGYLHIGGARTALFNWLFARPNRGTFILRIEDTDEERSTSQATDAILESLQWLGIAWDEGPIYRQSGVNDAAGMPAYRGTFGPYTQTLRLDIYRAYAQKLLSSGCAYRCYCTAEELRLHREECQRSGIPPKYNRKCRDLDSEECRSYAEKALPYTIRFKSPSSGATSFSDIIRGNVSFENEVLDDFVIMKSTNIPTYNFAVVVDDIEMRITHIIRGDDHISNTPRQILLYQALGVGLPVYAHVPMILGSDSSRLSKRHGAASVGEYRKQGYLPEALVNYLALLGWSTQDSQQIFSPEELIKKFDLKRCGKSAAIFDPQKLLWMNGEYIRTKKDCIQLLKDASPYLLEAGLITCNEKEEIMRGAFGREKEFVRAIELEQEKIKLLSEIPGLIGFLVQDAYDIDPGAVEKVMKKPGVPAILNQMREELSNADDFSSAALEDRVRRFCDRNGYRTSQVFHPVRVALSGRTQGPSLFGMMEFLGRDKVTERITRTICALEG